MKSQYWLNQIRTFQRTLTNFIHILASLTDHISLWKSGHVIVLCGCGLSLTRTGEGFEGCESVFMNYTRNSGLYTHCFYRAALVCHLLHKNRYISSFSVSLQNFLSSFWVNIFECGVCVCIVTCVADVFCRCNQKVVLSCWHERHLESFIDINSF